MKGRSKTPRPLIAFFFTSLIGVCLVLVQRPNLEYVRNGDVVFAAPLEEKQQIPTLIRIEAATPNRTQGNQAQTNNMTAVLNSTRLKTSPAERHEPPQENPQTNAKINMTVRDYIKKAAKSRFFKRNLVIVSWNSSGELDTNLLYQQCRFRNFVEPATHPFLLQKGNAAATPYHPHGVVALLATTDNVQYQSFDWDVPSPIPIIAWSAPIQVFYNRSWVYVVPTPFELSPTHGGGAATSVRLARQVSFTIPFQDRIPIMMYRGEKSMNPKQRGCVFELGQNTSNTHWLNATEKRLRMQDMVPYRYLLDVGGISGTTWIALRWKMCSGSLVFRVYSGNMDWWHTYLEPWKHYIPIRADVTDLKEKWEWAEAHPEESYRIAQAGEEICRLTLKKDRLHEELQKVIASLPPATAELRAELDSIMQDSFDRLTKNETALLFNPGEKPNPLRDFTCPR